MGFGVQKVHINATFLPDLRCLVPNLEGKFPQFAAWLSGDFPQKGPSIILKNKRKSTPQKFNIDTKNGHI